jgi:hypothetical protein
LGRGCLLQVIRTPSDTQLQSFHALLTDPDQSSAGTIEIGIERQHNRDHQRPKDHHQQSPSAHAVSDQQAGQHRDKDEHNPEAAWYSIFQRSQSPLTQID